MKTTIDLPEDVLRRAKIVAVQRKTTLKELVITGLNLAISPEVTPVDQASPLERLHRGLRLGGRRMDRDQTHER